jgi:hypothetical protein
MAELEAEKKSRLEAETERETYMAVAKKTSVFFTASVPGLPGTICEPHPMSGERSSQSHLSYVTFFTFR